ncbi:pentatricopeptide repeat-containing protein At4g04790, mitochondrial-like isoform X5 [Durio zibethinus]|uniref:Pentatricopeptide repeat-containing protein At4g04790, mitochondrial-like isoform X5 n=1 Tax=Durio zibethinus TaxID=66656 RepID=A0A6P5WMD8_DURZI|nr:pentatricopeptide repeat-containing protein At4g04790, mitochondrial-like isoform X5 [Durio zibethinus]
MTASKAKTLSSLFKTVVKKATKKSSLPAGDRTVKHFVFSLETSSSSPPPPSSSTSFTKRSPKPTKKPAPHGILSSRLLGPASTSKDSMENLSEEISSILCVGASDSSWDSEETTNNRSSLGRVLSIPWLSNLSNNNILPKQKEVSRERKQKWVFKKTQVNRFNRLIKMCGDKLGTKATMEVFDKLGRETGLKEYNALIAVCLEKARTSDDEDSALEHISEAFRTFKKMRERGFQVEEGTYGPFLRYFIDMGMVDEFHFFCGPIKEGNPSSLSRLGYYEMLLWIRVNNEEKIQELCNYIAADNGEDDFKLKENYLLALCVTGRKKDLIQLLEVIDVTRISSVNQVEKIFQSLGRLSLESFTEKFLLAFKRCGYGMDEISRLIFSYASGIPNLAFGGAYAMLNDLKKLNVTPTASIYNTIMAGYFREKNISGALMVLKQMECEDVKPDSQTFSYLIGNCNCEEDITKYREEMKRAGIQVTKHIFMALINAYTTCGQFEKAKEVLLDKGIPVKSLNEIKSVLVSAFASSGKMPDALNIYKEIKQNGGSLEPKAVISLIEHFTSEGELSILLQLPEELHDPDYWVDGCCRIILHCVRNKQLRSAVDLLKQLKDKFHNDDLAMEVIFDEVFSVIAASKPKGLQIGLALLQAIKDELGLTPSRKSLDFLLSACVNAKDLQNSLLIWNEYKAAGLPGNVLTFLRMYQALLASGDPKSAKSMLAKIPTDDPHVRCVIKACQTTYVKMKKQQRQNRNET